MVVEVKNNDVASALRVLKRKLMKAGQVGELKRRSAYEKPSERRNRRQRRAAQRARKMAV